MTGPSWDLLPVPMLELTQDAQACAANAAFGLWTGLAPDAALGTGWFACLPPDRRRELFAALGRSEDFRLEIRMLRADGTKGWADLQARWWDEADRFVCTLHDVTEARVAQLAAAADSERFRQLADNLPVMIAYYMRAAEHVCTWANRRYAATFRLDTHSIVGRTLPQVIGEEATRRILPHVEQAMATGESVSYRRDVVRPEGEARVIEVTLIPHKTADGTVIGSFVLINELPAGVRTG
ncbi:MAG: PAS domain-containing protein [Aquabacterium sp.]